MKLSIRKITSDQEILEVTVEGKEATDVAAKSAPVFEMLDERMIELNHRLVSQYQWLQKCPLEVRQIVDALFQLQFGRANEGTAQQIQLALHVIEEKEKVVKEQKAREAGAKIVEEVSA